MQSIASGNIIDNNFVAHFSQSENRSSKLSVQLLPFAESGIKNLESLLIYLALGQGKLSLQVTNCIYRRL